MSYRLCLQRADSWHIPLLCVQWKTADDEQMNCPKYEEFYSKNKFEKLVYLVGFYYKNKTVLQLTLKGAKYFVCRLKNSLKYVFN